MGGGEDKEGCDEINEAAANKMWQCYGITIKNCHISRGFWHNNLHQALVFFKQEGRSRTPHLPG
jgi:hypothetical protein